MLEGAINDIIEYTLGYKSQDDFQHLFDDMDLKSTKLGKDVKTRSKILAKVVTVGKCMGVQLLMSFIKNLLVNVY